MDHHSSPKKINIYWLLLLPVVIGGLGGYVLARGKIPGVPSRPERDEHIIIRSEQAKSDLRVRFRDLWADHVVWMRQYVVATMAESSDVVAISARLTLNQEEMGAMFVPYYGAKAGERFADLFKEHTALAMNVAAAVKAGEDENLKIESAHWYSNADEIAILLSGANPAWPKAKVREILDKYLALTAQDMTARAGSKWGEDAATFDRIFDQGMAIADMLANGIVAQFPKKF